MSRFFAPSPSPTSAFASGIVRGADRSKRDDENLECEPRLCSADFKLTPSGGDFGFVDTPHDPRAGTVE